MNNSIEARLLRQRRIDDKTGCWVWTGCTFTNGYGSIKLNGISRTVHKLSLERFRGVVFKEGEQANHKCDNKLCFNPDHLYVGSHQDNMNDFGSKCSKCGRPKIPSKRCEYCRRAYNRKYYRENSGLR